MQAHQRNATISKSKELFFKLNHMENDSVDVVIHLLNHSPFDSLNWIRLFDSLSFKPITFLELITPKISHIFCGTLQTPTMGLKFFVYFYWSPIYVISINWETSNTVQYPTCCHKRQIREYLPLVSSPLISSNINWSMTTNETIIKPAKTPKIFLTETFLNHVF